jgi:2,5-furandicarboxylate decarboxylase 1
MNLREFLRQAVLRGLLLQFDGPVEPDEQLARRIAAAGDRPIYFPSGPAGYRILAGVCAARRSVALALGVDEGDLLMRLVRALRQPVEPPVIDEAPCQEIVETEVDLERLPILTHTARDGGPYVTAGVAITRGPDGQRNMAFHRLQRLDRRRMAARLVENRGTHLAWSASQADLPVAIAIGAPVSAQLAGAISPPAGVEEPAVAHALAPTPFVRCLGVDLEVPAESEIILEGRITHEMVDEGPFIDLTGTFDIVRKQPVVIVDRITRRRDTIYQALLPGGPEHQLLMGMPREPTIYEAVSRVCEARDVRITPGGTSWLHAVVQIHKRTPDDGRLAGEAAFRGHGSLKHVVVVDDDVNIHDVAQVEWAIATRFQADRDLQVWSGQPSSSLDPSATHVPGQKSRTAKMALDATIPWDGPSGPRDPEAFARVDYFTEKLA